MGVLPPANAGLGIDASSATGCPYFLVGVATINTANCNTAAANVYIQGGPGIYVTGNGTQSNPYVISLGTTFAISSFTGSQTVELGYSLVNPVFSASYTTTPTSANITNTDSISSPTNLTTPFTSGTITGTFVHTTPATTTFTLSATQGATLTATQSVQWLPRSFGGVGAAGATSSVTASGTTAVLSNGAVLASVGLHTTDVGQTYGPFNPSAQKIYLLLVGGSHTFRDPNSGFTFPFLTPTPVTFVNAYGDAVTMYLYESAYALNVLFRVEVLS